MRFFLSILLLFLLNSAVGAAIDTLIKPLKKDTPAEDSDFVIKKPAFQYNLNKQPVPGQKFRSSRRAWMLSAVLPGAGQIYNKRYWKLPIVYGGFVGLGILINFNQKLYDQTLQYYRVLLINPSSLTVPLEYRAAPITQIASIKDFYRRNRDLSIIGTAALWVAGIVDAFVDSELKGFDVSNKLSMRVTPYTSSADNRQSSIMGSVSAGVKLSFNIH